MTFTIYHNIMSEYYNIFFKLSKINNTVRYSILNIFQIYQNITNYSKYI